MNNRYIIIFIALIIIVGGVWYAIPKKVEAPAPVPVTETQSTSTEVSSPATTTVATTTPVAPKPVIKPTPKPVTVTPTPTPTTPTVKTYTLDEISTHADKNNCWTTIDGNVYDITPYVPKHPGGVREITQVCGKDGTFLFKDQHSGDRKPNSILATYKIGVLAK